MSKDTYITINIYGSDYSRKKSLLGTDEKGSHQTLEIKTQDPRLIEEVTKKFSQQQQKLELLPKAPRQIEVLPSSSVPKSLPPSYGEPRKKFLGLF